jgi:hypothetical protein
MFYAWLRTHIVAGQPGRPKVGKRIADVRFGSWMQLAQLFDHFVGRDQQAGRNCET